MNWFQAHNRTMSNMDFGVPNALDFLNDDASNPSMDTKHAKPSMDASPNTSSAQNSAKKKSASKKRRTTPDKQKDAKLLRVRTSPNLVSIVVVF